MRRPHLIAAVAVGSAAVAAVLVLALGGGGSRGRSVRTARLDIRAADAGLVAASEGIRLLGGDLGPLIDRLEHSDVLTIRLPVLRRDGVVLRDVRLHEAARRIALEATVDPRELAAVTPGGLTPQYEPDTGGPGVVFGVTKSAAGFDVHATVRVAPARDGSLRATPEGVPIGPQTLFADPRVHVDGVRAREVPGGVRVRALATLAGG